MVTMIDMEQPLLGQAHDGQADATRISAAIVTGKTLACGTGAGTTFSFSDADWG